MAAVGNDCYCHFPSPYAQQKYSNISCFWERQPLGCVRISCAFHHSKPRYINGLFLPPTNNASLQQGVQEGTLHPAQCQKSPRNQEKIFLPIHPPLIINLNDEESDEEDDEEHDEVEEKYASTWVPKTAEDIEEEKAIKEICYRSGEYYRIPYPQELQSAKAVSSAQENEILPLEATEQDLQKGDGHTILTKSETTKKGGDSAGRRVPRENIPRTDRRSFKNAETNQTQLVKNNHRTELQDREWISKEPRNSSNTVTGKGIHTLDHNVKPCYKQRGQRKDDETASSVPSGREMGRKTYFSSSEPRRSAYVVYRTVSVSQEPKSNGSTAVPEPRGGKCFRQKNQPDTNRRFWTKTENYDIYASGSYNATTWKKRNPHVKTFSNFKNTIQQSQEDMEVRRKGERYVDRRKR